ncbi:MAG TPA: IS110 family transposase [Terriglobales bacterium]|nr:IS110 family transposase [Terriglobales bacterium]
MTIQRSKFIPRDYDLFAGLDVDKRSMSIVFLDHADNRRSLRMANDARPLMNYVRKHFAGQRVAFAYEAGPTGFGLHDELVQQAYTCMIAAPSKIPRAPDERVKTNRLDSRKLAENLRGGQLRGIHVPSAIYRDLRHLVQLRDTHVRELSSSKLRIKALLLFEGIPFPDPQEKWTARAIRELRRLPCSETVRFKLDDLLQTMDFHFQAAARATKQIRQYCLHEAELQQSIELLLSLPGIGWIVASHLVARLGDPQQIKNGKQIAGFLGIVSSEHSTGDKENRGEITRSGDSRLRSKLIQSAWTAIRKDPELRAFYRRIYQRHPKKVAARKAIVAVARKLTNRIYVVLKEQRPYVIRPDSSIAPLTAEEAVGPRGRLDAAQNEQS